MSYDDSLCFLSYLDGNWMFTLPNQCQGQNCTWNVFGAPYVTKVMPESFNRPFEYVCDNGLHTLGWLDAEDEPTLQNNYLCTCGGPLSITHLDITAGNGCANRCDRPWTAAFGQRCNVVTSTTKSRGNFTDPSSDPSQGSCISVAGKGSASPTFDAPVNPSAPAVIDGIGIANVCDGSEYNNGAGYSICSCDGQLPATAFGRRVENRNPCFLQLEADDTAIAAAPSRAWIAAPILGGLALVVLAGVVGFMFGRRQKRKTGEVRLDEEGENIAMQDIQPSAQLRRSISPTSETPSADSGIGLLNTAAPSATHERPPTKSTEEAA